MAYSAHEVFGGSHAPILGFLEQREPAHVRVGEAYGAMSVGAPLRRITFRCGVQRLRGTVNLTSPGQNEAS